MARGENCCIILPNRKGFAKELLQKWRISKVCKGISTKYEALSAERACGVTVTKYYLEKGFSFFYCSVPPPTHPRALNPVSGMGRDLSNSHLWRCPLHWGKMYPATLDIPVHWGKCIQLHKTNLFIEANVSSYT